MYLLTRPSVSYDIVRRAAKSVVATSPAEGPGTSFAYAHVHRAANRYASKLKKMNMIPEREWRLSDHRIYEFALAAPAAARGQMSSPCSETLTVSVTDVTVPQGRRAKFQSISTLCFTLHTILELSSFSPMFASILNIS
jgi:hypothetical protein